ncbi:hypothetical protein WJX74_004184 [Apatococcus lobatus]|uniref:Uncharacterized protein n=1 Tax=Apatococcus lobatus TaxID=904363 RepID=A0AAW1RP86_9CHLO
MMSTNIYNSGGQVFDLASFGERPLEYTLKARSDRYQQAAIWAMKFSPVTQRQEQTLGFLNAQLSEDRRVLRTEGSGNQRLSQHDEMKLSYLKRCCHRWHPTWKLATPFGSSTYRSQPRSYLR